MANILAKAIKLTKKEHKIKTKLLYPKGIKVYICKRDGRTQKFVTLATFDRFGVEFSAYRNSEIISFAVAEIERFIEGPNSRTMSEVSSIATHIAQVLPSGESVVYAIRKGDEFQPFYLDFTFKFFVQQTSDLFVPVENI